MKNAIDWIKSNPISVASVVVAFFGLLIFAYMYLMAAGNWRAEKAEILKGPAQAQTALIGQAVRMPNKDPNAEPDVYNVVINPQVIQDVSNIYQKIKQQYDKILADTGKKNSSRHLTNNSRASVMLARGAIWPDKLTFDLGERAKANYLEQHAALFTYNKDEGWNMPSMVGSNPPHPVQIQRTLYRTAFNFINSIGVTSAGELTQEQAEQLYSEQRNVLMKMLTNRARQIHLYVDLPRDQDIYAPKEEELNQDTTGGGGLDGGGIITTPGFDGGLGTEQDPGKAYPAGYPFRLEPWVFASEQPTPDEVWEGQVELWMIRDIMTAIHATNRVGEVVTVTKPSGEEVQEPASVINSPIKRLILLEPLPGYVGLHTTGGVQAPSILAAGDGSTPGFDDGFPGSVGVVPGGDFGGPATGSPGTPGTKKPSFYPTPAAELKHEDPTEEAPEHFGITPTGRVSNSVFDVRHTRLIIDIEAAELPAFIEELRQTNFMTVVKLNIKDVDEYQMLREGGYVYGEADVVRAELMIESLWFRNWTEKFMPKIVKQKLLIIEPDTAGIGGFDPNAPFPPEGF